MAINFMNMPAPQYPRSALLDFAPLGQAIDTYRQGAQQKAVMDQNRAIGQTAATQGATAAANQAYGLGRLEDGAALNKQGEGQRDRFVKRYGVLAQQIDLEGDPNKRARMWAGTLERMRREGASSGITGEFDPEELDPMTGPKLLMAQAGLLTDPLERQSKQADIGLKQAQAEYYRQKPMGTGGATDVVARKLMDADPNLSYLDAITLAKKGDVGFATEQKELAEERSKAKSDISRINDNASLALRTIESIRAHPGKSSGLGWTAATGYIPGTDARGFANLVDQAKGQTFLEAFNSLRGGGQITEAEGAKATQALARLDRYQSAADFEAALKDLEVVIRAGQKRAQDKVGIGTQQPAQTPKSYNWTPEGGLQEAR